MLHFGKFLTIWSLRSNSVTRQVNFNTKQKLAKNANIKKFKCDILSDFQTMWGGSKQVCDLFKFFCIVSNYYHGNWDYDYCNKKITLCSIKGFYSYSVGSNEFILAKKTLTFPKGRQVTFVTCFTKMHLLLCIVTQIGK